jgi:histone H3/H4
MRFGRKLTKAQESAVRKAKQAEKQASNAQREAELRTEEAEAQRLRDAARGTSSVSLPDGLQQAIARFGDELDPDLFGGEHGGQRAADGVDENGQQRIEPADEAGQDALSEHGEADGGADADVDAGVDGDSDDDANNEDGYGHSVEMEEELSGDEEKRTNMNHFVFSLLTDPNPSPLRIPDGSAFGRVPDTPASAADTPAADTDMPDAPAGADRGTSARADAASNPHVTASPISEAVDVVASPIRISDRATFAASVPAFRSGPRHKHSKVRGTQDRLAAEAANPAAAAAASASAASSSASAAAAASASAASSSASATDQSVLAVLQPDPVDPVAAARKARFAACILIDKNGNFRCRPGFRALTEIKKLQASTHNLISKKPMKRLIHEIMQDICPRSLRMTKVSIEALQTACEVYLTELFQDTDLCARHAGRVTINRTDMDVARRIRRNAAVRM